MTGIAKLDDILREMNKASECRYDSWLNNPLDLPCLATMDGTELFEFSARIENAVNDFLESKKSFFCTNTECPLKKTLSEEAK